MTIKEQIKVIGYLIQWIVLTAKSLLKEMWFIETSIFMFLFSWLICWKNKCHGPIVPIKHYNMCDSHMWSYYWYCKTCRKLISKYHWYGSGNAP